MLNCAFAQTSVKVWNGTRSAQVLNTGANPALACGIVDGSGNQITSFGGGVQYTEGDIDATPTGTAAMWQDASNAIHAAGENWPLPIGVASSITLPVDPNYANSTANPGSATSSGSTGSSNTNLYSGNVTLYRQVSIQLLGTWSGTVNFQCSNDGTNFSACAVRDMSTGAYVTSTTSNGIWSAGASTTNFRVRTATINSGTVSSEVLLSTLPSNELSNGAATESTLSTLNGKVTACNTGSVTISTFPDNEPINIAQMNGTAVTMGNGASGTGVQRVTIASDSTGVLACTQSGTWNVNNVSGTVSLPTGAATSANQTTEITSLQLIDDAVTTTASAITTKGLAASGTDGTNARILKTDTSGELQIDVLTIPSVTIGTFPDNEPFNVAQINGVAPSMGNGASGTGVQRVTIASDSTGIVNQGGTWTVQPGNTANTTPWLVTQSPATSGGLTTYHLVSAASTNATNIKASAGQLYCYSIFNTNASMRKVAFHNTAGAPTAGASVFFSLPIPGSGGANVCSDSGIPFSSGIAITTVTGAADSDNTAVGANDLIINLFYK
jgi:hypothetical protein